MGSAHHLICANPKDNKYPWPEDKS
ncbi:Protein of unknown function [Pyronema omphalodes CBS 100304]|uniref:Uncharacterized protein n=1 Tax=Pyronema omphalodes (strain CBS 100304) TaxID=1076935 RepID=U4L5J7_PYROM|nr:Protein of unknown function [Pyronema omphalodes CBS 100304]